LRMQVNGGEKLNGKKVSFCITSFLSDKQTFDAIETPINLSDITKTNASQTIPLDMNNIPGGGGALFKELKAQGVINILKTDQMNLALPKINFMHISNIGHVDGRLHIQTKWGGDGINDHGYFYFADTGGNRLDIYPTNIYFGTDESGNTKYGRNYIEYIFDIDKIKLNEAKLMGHFVTHRSYTTGNWKTTFKIQSVGEERQTNCNIKFDKWIANHISASPMGITLVGSGQGNDSPKITVSANMADGTVQKFESVMSFSENGAVKYKFTSSLPLDVAKVKSVTVDGTTISFN